LVVGQFTRFPARNSGYNLHIEVFSIGLFIEKSRAAVCDDPMHALRKSLWLWHMAMCGLCRANVPPASRPMSPRSFVITLTCINLWWQRVVRISATVSRSQRGRQGQWRIIRHALASLQNTVILPPPYAGHHSVNAVPVTIMLVIHTAEEVKVARENFW